MFPALFAAGMTLIDTTDGVLMLGAYGWAFMKPIRKLYYNMTITAVSVVVALVVGGLETLNLIGDQLGLTDGGGFWGAIGAINDNFGILGYAIIGIFLREPGLARSSSTSSRATTSSRFGPSPCSADLKVDFPRFGISDSHLALKRGRGRDKKNSPRAFR